MRVLKLIILGALCAPSIVFGQPKNGISIQTGIMHFFFDKSPLINLKYPSKDEKPFNGILINSVGFDFSRKINSKYGLSIEAMYFFESYSKNYIEGILFQAGDRGFLTFNPKYDGYHVLNPKWNSIYGAGIAFRFGHENVIINSGQIDGGFMETNVINCNRSDIGFNGYFGYEYIIFRNMSIFSKIDFLGFFYLNDKTTRSKLREIYNVKGFPSRFDLSLKLGISFNF